jgi:hypothetical protein
MNSTIGVSTWSLQPLTYKYNKQLPELIETIAGMGVDGLDLYDEYLPVYPDTNLYKLNEIKKMADAVKLPVTGTWFFNDLLGSYYAVSLDVTVENTRRFLAVTASLGAPYMSVPFLLNVPGLSTDEAFTAYCKIFEKLLPTAEEYKVHMAAETARQYTPGLALKLQKYLDSPYFTICPDLEAWRLETEDIPLVHQENADGPPSKPEPLSIFNECLPYSPYIHFKLLVLDETGEEPHFPIAQIMDMINKSPIKHHLCIEYEGWIPDLRPERDAVGETKRCVELIRRYQK